MLHEYKPLFMNIKSSILCAFLLTISILVIAQNVPTIIDSAIITRVQWRDSIFKIDKSQIPTGFLLEYSLFGFDSTKYNGVGNNDDTLKQDGEILALHNKLFHCKVNNNATIELTDTLFSRAFFANRANGSIPLTFIFQKYNRFKPSALSNNLVQIGADSVGLYDVPGRPSSPYDSSEIFAFGPYITEITKFGNITFTLPANLFYVREYDTVEIDFNDGAGYRKLAKGSAVNIYYATEGLKFIKAKLKTAFGSRLATAQISYKRPVAYYKADTSWTISVPPIYTSEANYLGLQGPNGPIQCQGSLIDQLLCNEQPGAWILVLKSCDGTFDKPVLIVEGFDPKQESSFEKYTDRFYATRTLENLGSFGYDFVIVRFKNNNDFIEHNAKVLEQVINNVNQAKLGNHKINIIGISMGGLITRWCLKDMEDRNLTHNVDNYFSFDSPHQGANIPLGIQLMFREMATDLPFIKWFGESAKAYQSFQSRAARQMMVVYGKGTDNTLNPLRAEFAAKLEAKGYPQQCRNLGIALGRGNNIASTKSAGTGQQFTPSNPLDPGDKIFNALIRSPWLFVDIKAYAVKEGGQQGLVTSYKFYGYKPSVFFIPYVPTIPLVRLRIRDYYYTGQFPYEDAPGGFENTQKEFADKFPGSGTDGHDGHNFTAVASVLDLRNQGYSQSNAWQSNNMFYNIDNQITNAGQVGGNRLLNTTLSPFYAVTTSTSDCGTPGNPPCTPLNQKHSGNVTPEASRFIRRYIRNAPISEDCNSQGFCSLNPSISGPQLFCTSTASYLLTNLANGLTINWQSVNGRFRITGGQGTPQIQVEKLSDGSDIVRVQITNACGLSRIVELNINVGAPDAPVIVSHSYDYFCGSFVEASASQPPFITGHIWNLNFGQVVQDLSGYGSDYFYHSPLVSNPQYNFTYYNYLSVQARNICGTSSPSALLSLTVGPVPISCSGGGGQLRIAPNPTPESTKVQSTDNTGFSEIRVIDKLGNTRKIFRFPAGTLEATISLSGLPADIYTLRILSGSEWKTKRLIKN